jgi:hypothetical protein
MLTTYYKCRCLYILNINRKIKLSKVMDRLHEEVIQSRKPNRQGNDFLRYAETTMIQIDKPRDIRGRVIKLDDWMLASFDDTNFAPELQDIYDRQLATSLKRPRKD